MHFSIFTLFCLCFANGSPAGLKTNPRSVNLALETVLQFDRDSGNTDLKIIDDVQNIIDTIRKVIGTPRKAQFRAGSTHFTEFLHNAITILQTYKGKDLKDLVEKLDGVLNNYQFVSFGPNSIYRRIEKFRKTPAVVIRNNMKDFDNILRRRDFNERQMKDVEYLEKSFANETVNLEMILNDLKYYKEHGENRKVNLTILLKNDVKSLLFKKTPADREKLVQIFTDYFNLVTDTNKEVATDANYNLRNKENKGEGDTSKISKKRTKPKESLEKELIRESVKGRIKHKENVNNENRHKQKLRHDEKYLGDSKLVKANSFKNNNKISKAKNLVKRPKWFEYSDNTEMIKAKTKEMNNKKSLEINEKRSPGSDMETSTTRTKEAESSDMEIQKSNKTNKQKSQESSSDTEDIVPDNLPLKLEIKKAHKELNAQRMKVDGIPNIVYQSSSESESNTKTNGNSPEINIFVSLVTATTPKEQTTEPMTYPKKSKLKKKKVHVPTKDENKKKEAEGILNRVGTTNRYATIGFYSEENNTAVETVKATTKRDEIGKTVEKETNIERLKRQKSVEMSEEESSESKSESNESNQEGEDKEIEKESDKDTGETVEESESDKEKVHTAKVASALKMLHKKEKSQNGNNNVGREQNHMNENIKKRSNNWRLPIKYVHEYKNFPNEFIKPKRRYLVENGFKKGTEAINDEELKTEGSSKTKKNHHSKKNSDIKSNMNAHIKPEKQSNPHFEVSPELEVTTSIEKNSIEATTRYTYNTNVDSIQNKTLTDSNITEIQSDKAQTISTTLKGPDIEKDGFIDYITNPLRKPE